MSLPSWFTEARVRVYAGAATVGSALTLLLWIAAPVLGFDLFAKPMGLDFSSFYVAGSMALQGEAAAAYDMHAMHRAAQVFFGSDAPLYVWPYPPFVLLAMSALARLPYGLALGSFLVATFAVWWTTLRRIAPRTPAAFWAIAGAPGVLINAIVGQNAFLVTALMATGLMLLERRPVMAGIALGLLAFKPQFLVLVPVALLAGGHWRVLVSAGVTAAALSVIALLAYGSATWQAFFTALSFSREAILDGGGTGFEKLQSVLSAIRLLGGSASAAWIAQSVVSVTMVLLVWRTWRSPTSLRGRAATLVVATMLATPFLNFYDLLLAALPIALLAGMPSTEALRARDAVTFILAWLLPFLVLGLTFPLHLPVTPFVLVALLATGMRKLRSAQDR